MSDGTDQTVKREPTEVELQEAEEHIDYLIDKGYIDEHQREQDIYNKLHTRDTP